MPRSEYGPGRSGYDCVSTWNSRIACVGSLRMRLYARANSLVARGGAFGMTGPVGAGGAAVCELGTGFAAGSAGVAITGAGAADGGGAGGTSASNDALKRSVLPYRPGLSSASAVKLF